MKNTLKSVGIIAFVAIVGFSMVACNNSNGSGEHTGPGSRNAPITLQENTWHNGNITGRGHSQYFVFAVEAGVAYRFWVNDAYSGDGSKTLDVTGNLTIPGGEVMEWDDHWTNPKYFTPTMAGQVQVEVKAFTPSETGTFGIVFTRGIARPQ